ncbi:MAG: MaoC family dehydratase N-terminal domain-containing protein [Clostridia bacterium]|nr:MaoC family dehydratase N-terminal domain-containing protein [Clostridia bacterium]
MPGRYFEDFQVGESFVSPRRTITEADVVLFAGLSGDFNPLHTDRVFAETTPFKQPIAHGLLVLAVATGLNARMGLNDGTALALLGIDEWRFVRPVFFGDTVHVRVTIVDKRETSKPDRGILIRKFEVFNQRDELVQEGYLNLMVRRRPAEAQA